MISAALGVLIWQFILQHVATVAQSVVQNVGSDEFKKLIDKLSVKGKVEKAVGRAYKRFATTLNDPAFLQELERPGGFTSSSGAAQILAQAALDPLNLDTQVARLAALMRACAAAFSPQRCESAARLLIAQVHQEISGISALRDGLQLLETRRVRERLERPAYAPGLYERIERMACDISRHLNHGYISAGHLLYAIVRQPRSDAAWTLLKLKVTEANIRDALTIIEPKHDSAPCAKSKGVRLALERAPELARARGAFETGTEHILLALAELALQGQQPGITIRAIFERLNVEPQRLYDTTDDDARSQGAFESAVMSFSGAENSDPAAPPNEADLPIDARETLRLFGS